MRQPQPIRAYLAANEWTVAGFVDATGVRPHGHVINAIAGRAIPSPELRKRAVEVLGVELDKLWEADVLRREWAGPRGRGHAAVRAEAATT